MNLFGYYVLSIGVTAKNVSFIAQETQYENQRQEF